MNQQRDGFNVIFNFFNNFKKLIKVKSKLKHIKKSINDLRC